MTDNLSMADEHRPTDSFRDYLEDEVTRVFRRDRLARRARYAVVVLVSLGIGATAGLASAQVRQGAQRDSLLDAARADATLVNVRLGLARAQLAQEQKLAAAGATSAQSVAAAEIEVRLMESQLGRAELNIDEIVATGSSPRDELNAPLVGKRDFVKERIELELMSMQQHLQVAEQLQRETARRVRAGALGELASVEVDLDVAKAQRDLAAVAERLTLRREFLEKGTPVDQLMNRLEKAELRFDLNVAQRALKLAQSKLALLEGQRSAGLSTELEVMKAQIEVKERQIELQRLTMRLGKTG